MRRLFVVRKDLKMSTGKISAQLAHCAECYWLRLIQENTDDNLRTNFTLTKEVWNDYINGHIVKVICEAKDKFSLLKAKKFADNLGLVEGKDFGFIYDACYTELTPEEPDGTCLTAFWTAPLPDEVSHKISKKYQLFTDKQPE